MAAMARGHGLIGLAKRLALQYIKSYLKLLLWPSKSQNTH